MSYTRIAYALKITTNEVQYICRKAAKNKTKFLTFKQSLHKLEKEHVDFLLSPKTLELWAGLTMKQKTVMFHRRYPNKRLAITSLRRLYLKNMIKRKKVR